MPHVVPSGLLGRPATLKPAHPVIPRVAPCVAPRVAVPRCGPLDTRWPGCAGRDVPAGLCRPGCAGRAVPAEAARCHFTCPLLLLSPLSVSLSLSPSLLLPLPPSAIYYYYLVLKSPSLSHILLLFGAQVSLPPCHWCGGAAGMGRAAAHDTMGRAAAHDTMGRAAAHDTSHMPH